MSLDKKIHEIEKAILQTIAFFDLFDFPMTKMEIWKYLSCKCALFDVEKIINDMLIDGNVLKEKDGFYFLAERDEIVYKRNRRYNFVDRKFKRAIRVAKIFKYIPWINFIGIGNIIGENNLRNGSDIDFFIICRENRIWATRFFCVLVVKFLGLRPKVNDVRDKICLSFYMSESNLDLKRIMINNKLGNLDRYILFWLASLVPIFDNKNIYQKIIDKNNWIYNYLPNWKPFWTVDKRTIKKGTPNIYFYIVNTFLGIFEGIYKKIQLKIIPIEIRNAISAKDGSVIVSDDILKLHVNDRRRKFIDSYFDKLRKLNAQF